MFKEQPFGYFSFNDLVCAEVAFRSGIIFFVPIPNVFAISLGFPFTISYLKLSNVFVRIYYERIVSNKNINDTINKYV